MESDPNSGKHETARPDDLSTAIIGAAVLAPGGFVAGYLLGRSLGVLLSGCPLRGPCEEATPVLIAIPASILGMGVGCTLAAVRVSRWWEGVVAWAAGILSMIFLVALVGWLGTEATSARLIALGWLLFALGFGVSRWWRDRSPT